MNCKICDAKSAHFAEAVLMSRYKVAYFRCINCGFVQTEEPYWLDDAYAEAINRADVGLIRRNLRLVKIAKALIVFFFDGNKRFVDYGGGYGLFVRMMRDAGFDFYRCDKHCANIFAPDFEAEPVGHGEYELLTAFEVFEHLVNPVEEIREMLSYSDNIFFTTELLAAAVLQPGSSAYYGLDHGQHVSFYTLRSLQSIAERFSLNLYSDGKFRHLLTTRKKLSPLLFNVVSIYKVAALLNPVTDRKSLVPADYKRITGKELL